MTFIQQKLDKNQSKKKITKSVFLLPKLPFICKKQEFTEFTLGINYNCLLLNQQAHNTIFSCKN